MRWIIWLIGSVGVISAGIYLVGCWLLHVSPWACWYEAHPIVYDGKEPWEEWARKMEQARRLQEREDGN